MTIDDDKIDTDFIIDLEEERRTYENVGKIGEGATSITYKLIDKQTKKPLCKKVIKYKNGDATIKDAQRVLNEFEVMYRMTHPCICKAFFINTSEPISIFLEYLDYSLADLLKTRILSDTTKAKIVLEIVYAMNYLHKQGMMHRDLKIENIMLNSLCKTKLIDFGLVIITEVAFDGSSFVEDSLTKGIGTLSYMSPEMTNEEEYDSKTDVYSFGIVLHLIFVGNLPKIIIDRQNDR